jgi:hypothetical protein
LRTPFGRIARGSITLILAIVATIAIGMLLPGKAGTIVEVAGWIVLAVFLILEIGLRWTPSGNHYGNDRGLR